MRAWVLFAVLMLIPVGAASEESTPVRMHFHINGWQDFIISTQPMEAGNRSNMEGGLAMVSGCQETPTGILANQAFQTWYGYQSPGRIVFGPDGEPQVYHERGIATDLRLDTDVQPVLDWYVSPSTAREDLGVGLNMRLDVTIREGDEVSVGNAAYNEGTIVATGSSDTVNLIPGASGVTQHDVDGTTVYGFHVPLDLHRDDIADDDGYNIRIDLYMDEPLCDGEDHGTSPTHFQPHASDDLRPGMDWNVIDPIYIEAIHPQFAGDDLVIIATVQSAFGSGDVGGFMVDVPGAQHGPEMVAIEMTCRAHNCEDVERRAMEPIWVWDYSQEAPGIYDVTVTATNLQGTASDSKTFQFQVGDDRATICSGDVQRVCETRVLQDQAAPGLPSVTALAFLGLAAIFTRRQ